MARIAYGTITVALRDLIANDGNVRQMGATVVIGEYSPSAETMPYVTVFEGRRSPTPGQPIAAGQRTRYTLRWTVHVVVQSGQGFADAAGQRDELLGYIEVALMQDRSLGGALPDHSIQLLGGEMDAGPSGVGMVARATLELEAINVASTT